MVIYDETLKQKLETLGLPVYYNQFVDSTVKTPCITYEPMSNVSYLEGMYPDSNSVMYSKIDYYIRLWGHDKEVLMPYMEQIADLMMKLGFRRAAYHELISDTQLCLASLYKATGYEKK